MPSLPDPILRFLTDNPVLSLCLQGADGPWAASCFYVLDASMPRLILLSDVATRHGRLMLESPAVAGTVSGQPRHLRDIRGVQFTARSERLLDEDARQLALDLYLARHPMARLFNSDVWSLRLETVKMTDNSLLFARKTRWQA